MRGSRLRAHHLRIVASNSWRLSEPRTSTKDVFQFLNSQSFWIPPAVKVGSVVLAASICYVNVAHEGAFNKLRGGAMGALSSNVVPQRQCRGFHK